MKKTKDSRKEVQKWLEKVSFVRSFYSEQKTDRLPLVTRPIKMKNENNILRGFSLLVVCFSAAFLSATLIVSDAFVDFNVESYEMGLETLLSFSIRSCS